MSAPQPPTTTNLVPFRGLAVTSKPIDVNAGLVAQCQAQAAFIETTRVLRVRADALKARKDARSKELNAAIKATNAAVGEQLSGEPWVKVRETVLRIRDGAVQGEEWETVARELASFSQQSHELYDRHAAAEATKARQIAKLNGLLTKAEGALATMLRRGPMGRPDVEDTQTELPGMEQPPEERVQSWLQDPAVKGPIIDAVAYEVREADKRFEAAKAAGNEAATREAETAARRTAELREQLIAAGVIGEDDGLVLEDDDIPVDEEPSTSGTPPERAEPVEGETFVLQPDGPPAGLEDPTKHPALQSAIKEQADKRKGRAKKGDDAKPAGRGKGQK